MVPSTTPSPTIVGPTQPGNAPVPPSHQSNSLLFSPLSGNSRPNQLNLNNAAFPRLSSSDPFTVYPSSNDPLLVPPLLPDLVTGGPGTLAGSAQPLIGLDRLTFNFDPSRSNLGSCMVDRTDANEPQPALVGAHGTGSDPQNDQALFDLRASTMSSSATGSSLYHPAFASPSTSSMALAGRFPPDVNSVPLPVRGQIAPGFSARRSIGGSSSVCLHPYGGAQQDPHPLYHRPSLQLFSWSSARTARSAPASAQLGASAELPPPSFLSTPLAFPSCNYAPSGRTDSSLLSSNSRLPSASTSSSTPLQSSFTVTEPEETTVLSSCSSHTGSDLSSTSDQSNRVASSPYGRRSYSKQPRLTMEQQADLAQLAKQPIAHLRITTAKTKAASASRRKTPALFVCPVPGCESSFTRALNLRGHLYSHTDQRPYKCRFCDRSFARTHDKRRHEKLVR